MPNREIMPKFMAGNQITAIPIPPKKINAKVTNIMATSSISPESWKENLESESYRQSSFFIYISSPEGAKKLRDILFDK